MKKFDIVDFLFLLEETRDVLLDEMKSHPFRNSSNFERRVNEVIREQLHSKNYSIEPTSNNNAQVFPDICLGTFGIEVKYTEKDTWRGVANSISQGMKDPNVKTIYVLWCKEGSPNPDIKYRPYEDVVIHVRTSHVPRFEIDMQATESLFNKFKVSYDEFTDFSMPEKMELIRAYVKDRVMNGSKVYYWWLESQVVDRVGQRTLLLFSELSNDKKTRYALEEIFLFSQAVLNQPSWTQLFDWRVNYFLNKHRFLYPQSFLLAQLLIQKDDLKSEDIIDFVIDNEFLSESVFNTIDPNSFRVYSSWWESPQTPTFKDWKSLFISKQISI